MITLLIEYLNKGYQALSKQPERILKRLIKEGQSFDVIVVPGVPFQEQGWDPVMKSRVLWSYFLYQSGMARNIIYSGAAVYSGYYEARIMGLYAQQLGVPASGIFYETRAEHSTENVFYAYELARKLGFKSIALATDPVQSAFLRPFTRRRFGTHITHIPIVMEKISLSQQPNPHIDASLAIATGFVPIARRQRWWTRLRGTFGMNIPWTNLAQKKAPVL
jgi:uncharacterized SAM-binding protein YcdF (DUF218 family)